MTKVTQIALVLSLVGMSGSAMAGDDKKAPAPAPADKKAPPPAPADKKAPPAPAMVMPKVPQEVTDMLKGATGTFKCTGKDFMPDGTAADMTATMNMKADLDGFWVHESFAAKMGKDTYKFEAYMTYDAGMKKWRRVQVDNMGGQSTGMAAMTGMKMDMDMDSYGPMGNGKFRDHYDGSDMKAGAHSWGEASMDGGKTFTKVYDMVCKK